jgi:hypothetical protein
VRHSADCEDADAVNEKDEFMGWEDEVVVED